MSSDEYKKNRYKRKREAAKKSKLNDEAEMKLCCFCDKSIIKEEMIYHLLNCIADHEPNLTNEISLAIIKYKKLDLADDTPGL